MVFRSILPSLLLCGVPPPSLATIASPHPFDELQPDNVTRVRLRINGDDTFRYFSTEDGYTVVRDATDYYTYADRNATGHLVPTAYVVGTVLASGSMTRPPFRKGMLPSRSVIRSQCRRCREEPERWRPFSSDISAGGDMAAAVEGVVKNLVVMIRFKNHVNRQLPSRATVQAVMNGLDGDKISVRSAYKEMSYGKMDLVSVVTGWITVPGTEQYYADNNYGDSDIVYEMFYDSLNILKNRNFAFKNFDADGDGQIDAITFLHSGYGAEWGGTDCYGHSSAQRIWSHKSRLPSSFYSNDEVRVRLYHVSPGVWGLCGSEAGHVGVICHETGHFFGLDDLYDTNGGGYGISYWGLMADSWDWGGNQNFPPHFCAWHKEQLGFTNPKVLTKDGVYTLRAAELHPDVFKITYNFPAGEYLLIENRQPLGTERNMPNGGLAIWHVDLSAGLNKEGYPGQSGWPTNGMHYRIALLQADGAYNMERGRDADAFDLWRGPNKRSIGPSAGKNGPYPNTDSYRDGNIQKTGVTISEISRTGNRMTFRLTLGTGYVPTPAPVAPTPLPTTSPPTPVPTTSSPTPAPTKVCQDNNRVSFGWRQTCSTFVAVDPDRRCDFEHRGRKLRRYCRKTCDNCRVEPTSPPTNSPFFPSSVPTPFPTGSPSASPATPEPTHSPEPSVSTAPSYPCLDRKPFFCNLWVKENARRRCRVVRDGERVKDTCRKTCANCAHSSPLPTRTPTTGGPTGGPTHSASTPPSGSPSALPTTCFDYDCFFCNLWVKRNLSRCALTVNGDVVKEVCRKTCSVCT